MIWRRGWLVEYIEGKGYSTEANAEFKESKVSDLVFSIVLPMVRRRTGRNIRLSREKKIVSTDNTTEGQEESVVMDRIRITEGKFVLIVWGKRSSTREGINSAC